MLVSRPRPSVRAQQVDNRRKAIVQAAFSLLESRLRQSFSMRDVAALLTFPDSNLYRYFKSRSDLLVLLLQEAVRSVETYWEQRDNPRLSYCQRIDMAVAFLKDFPLHHFADVRLLTGSVLLDESEAVWKTHEASIRKLTQRFQNLIDLAHLHHENPSDRSAPEIVDAIRGGWLRYEQETRPETMDPSRANHSSVGSGNSSADRDSID